MGRSGAGAVTWYQHAVAYAEMKWPHLAPHSRASLADALATVTPLLTRETGRRPAGGDCAPPCTDMPSTPGGASDAPGSGHRQRAGLGGAGIPAGQPARRPARHPRCPGRAVHAAGRLPAAANTIARKRAVFHGALGYAVELGLLPANPIGLVRWRAPRAAAAVSPATVPARRRSGRSWPGRPDQAGAGRVLRLPVLRGAAPRRSRRAAPR